LDDRSLGRIAGDFYGFVLLFTEAPDADRQGAAVLRTHLQQLLDRFAKHPELQRVPPEEIQEARFAMVAFADEMILRSDWSGREEWLASLLQLQLFQTNRAGDEFYQHLQNLRPDQTHAREAYFLSLALGFEGAYAGMPAERAELIRQQFEFLRSSGRALDLASTQPVAPPAYALEIHLRGSSGKRLWPVLLTWALIGGATLAVLWAVLRYFATSVPLPPGI
jgi:type IV/VI secretion system ImpK/VasF family protein